MSTVRRTQSSNLFSSFAGNSLPTNSWPRLKNETGDETSPFESNQKCFIYFNSFELFVFLVCISSPQIETSSAMVGDSNPRRKC